MGCRLGLPLQTPRRDQAVPGCRGGSQCAQGPLAQFPGRSALPRIPGVGVPTLPGQPGVEGSWDLRLHPTRTPGSLLLLTS